MKKLDINVSLRDVKPFKSLVKILKDITKDIRIPRQVRLEYLKQIRRIGRNEVCGVDLSNTQDDIAYTREILIKHKCGHSYNRKLCGYASRIILDGEFEEQIQKKKEYFENLDCLKCKISKYSGNKDDGNANET